MKRIYRKYTEWEDYKNGMYTSHSSDYQDEIDLIDKSIELLSNQDRFFNVALKMINEWSVAAENNLSNKDCNRKAWIGQATCSYNHNCPEILTRKSWAMMTLFQRYEANKTANKIIKIYEKKVNSVHRKLGDKLLF